MALIFDGVCVEIDLGIIRLIDHMNKEDRDDLKKFYYIKRANLLNPLDFLIDDKDTLFFITGRELAFKDVTLAWASKYYPDSHLIFVETGHLEIGQSFEEWNEIQAQRKAKAINENNIEVYFDDNVALILRLRELCPNCKCILYGGRPSFEC